MATRVTQVSLEVVVTPDATVAVNPPTVAPHDCAMLRAYYVPAVAVMGNGQPGMVLRAQPSPYVATPNRVYFVRFNSESSVVDPVIELWNFDTYIVGLAYYKSKLVAIAWDPATQTLKARTSADNGASWTASADLGDGIGPRAFKALGAGGSGGPGLRLTTNRDGTSLYLFYVDTVFPGKNMLYKVTSNASALAGWGSELDSGFDIPSIGRNFGGPTARNSQDTVAFSGPIETDIDGTWVVGAESDDGDFHANHAIFKGVLGGAWVRKYNDGHGGGLSGGQGSNGAMFRDGNGDLVCTITDDNGTEVISHTSSDNGESWWATSSSVYNQMPALVIGLGQHTGAYIAAWGRTYLFGGLAGLEPFTTEKTDLYASRMTFDPSEASLMFNDVLGESGIYGCAAATTDCSPNDFVAPPPLAPYQFGAGRPLSSAPGTGQSTQVERAAPKAGSAISSAPRSGSARSDS